MGEGFAINREQSDDRHRGPDSDATARDSAPSDAEVEAAEEPSETRTVDGGASVAPRSVDLSETRTRATDDRDAPVSSTVADTVTHSPTSLPPSDSKEASSSPDDAGPSITETRSHGASDAVDATMTHGAAEPDAVGEGTPELRTTADRYRLRGFLGSGGMGEVFLADDEVLAREVAIKYVRPRGDVVSDGRRDAFVREARVSGRLDHPNIPPVYDLGVGSDGRPFYVMRWIQGRSLKAILGERRSDGTSWSLGRLLALFQQACLALDFAHSRGVVHLDVKPANIMVGEYGELYVVDWGLSASTEETSARGLRGTPAYMSPEQAEAKEVLTPASDVFSLGVVLYEIATGQRAFGDSDTEEVLARVKRAAFDDADAFRRLPDDLRDTIRSALALDPALRPRDPRALHDRVQEFLDGTKERARKLAEARGALESAELELETRRAFLRDAGEAQSEADRLRPESWTPAEEKAEFWRAEDRAEELRLEAEHARERATRHMFEAYEHAPSDDGVRERLGELYWDQFTEAEERRDVFQQRFFESQIRRLDLPRIEARLRGLGSFRVGTVPEAERATLHRLSEQGRRLRPVEAQELTVEDGVVTGEDLPCGRWQITLERDGCRPLVAPLFVEREVRREFEWSLRTDAEIGDDFVQVPAGEFVMGGDAQTFMSVDRCRPHVGEFFIGRFAITWSEYQTFLQALADRSPDEAREHLPAVISQGGESWFLDDAGRVQFAREERVAKDRARWPI
ncbi:MAG: protein kinase, partial [Planctomycetota bacterium]